MEIIDDALRRGRMVLSDRGVESAALDAALLLMRATGLTRTELATKRDKPLSPEETRRYNDFISQRAEYKPVQYILNSCQFMSLDFYVDQRVLIPRPDTEILADTAIAEAGGRGGPVMALEIGVGSGALAVALAVYAPNAVVTAVDISGEALEVARINASAHNVLDRINLIRSDMFDNIPSEYYDIIMSNPPYIESGDISGLASSVRDYEPRLALDGGPDGVTFLGEIIERSGDYLNAGGALFLETGYNQAEKINVLMEQFGYTQVKIIKDLSNKARVVTGFR